MSLKLIHNDDVIIRQNKAKKPNLKNEMFGMLQVSTNYGTIIHISDEHKDLLGKDIYFKHEYLKLYLEGEEVLVMKYANLLATESEDLNEAQK